MENAEVTAMAMTGQEMCVPRAELLRWDSRGVSLALSLSRSLWSSSSSLLPHRNGVKRADSRCPWLWIDTPPTGHTCPPPLPFAVFETRAWIDLDKTTAHGSPVAAVSVAVDRHQNIVSRMPHDIDFELTMFDTPCCLTRFCVMIDRFIPDRIAGNHICEATNIADKYKLKYRFEQGNRTETKQATNNFQVDRVLRRGGCGHVYKGILPDGMAVAVGRASGGFLQGSRWNFWLQMLIYKFLPRGNLRDHLKPIVNFDYGSRIRIALGTAKAILYLHTEENLFIFLCSIKTNNIPLDQNSNAKAFDFESPKHLSNSDSSLFSKRASERWPLNRSRSFIPNNSYWTSDEEFMTSRSQGPLGPPMSKELPPR
uniref:Protein kinase domain-containing protein n=1 Tax=Physcomitrium patens TaxID=3218 RepID=A0A7I4AIH8_PHYPA